MTVEQSPESRISLLSWERLHHWATYP